MKNTLKWIGFNSNPFNMFKRDYWTVQAVMFRIITGNLAGAAVRRWVNPKIDQHFIGKTLDAMESDLEESFKENFQKQMDDLFPKGQFFPNLNVDG